MEGLSIKAGMVLIAKNHAGDKKIWFIFHHDDQGSAAIDLTTPHPDISYSSFENSLKWTNTKPALEILLLGGPEKSNDAMIILHQTDKSSLESNVINDDFSFLAYRLVLIPGQPPVIQNSENAPTQIQLSTNIDFLITIGYRTWTAGLLEEEIKNSLWSCFFPDTLDIFDIPHENRRQQLLKKLN